ncbi:MULTISPECIES: protein-tyrosine phosphatase family protein [Mycolicibacterium]|nr:MULTISPECIES: tyrosine-protein phosphatase [Mycolicibacterium]MDR7288630.1 hypothetical protein [Mycolicibacterium senegalense]
MERRARTLIEWAHEYNGYQRLAGNPSRLADVLRPVMDEFRSTRVIPEWAGVDLLRGWAFWCVRAHRHGGAYGPIEEEFPEFTAIVEALRHHPGATDDDRPPLRATPWPHDDVLHAWWVKPNRLLAGEYPGAATPERAEAKTRVLLDAGIDTVIDLTTEADHLTPYRALLHAAAEKSGRTVRHFAHPIPDFGVTDDAGYDAILARIHSELDAGRNVYVHCWDGQGRTSTVIGCLLAESGLSYDDVIARIAELRTGTRKAAISCPESAAQHDLLRARCAR